jgi:hypothetical protein
MVNFAGEDPADDRHGHTEKEVPRDPAAPRPIDEARQERNQRAEREHQQDIRAQAVSLAAQLYLVPASEGLILPVNVFDLADEITAYITDGTKP